jgi:hypothetical protein
VPTIPPPSDRYVNFVSKPLQPAAANKIVTMRDQNRPVEKAQDLHFHGNCANHVPKQRERIQLGKLATVTTIQQNSNRERHKRQIRAPGRHDTYIAEGISPDR